jgi:UDP-N-acetylglucosamine acyltransferase
VSIHPSASVDPSALVHTEAEIGAFAVVGPLVKVGRGAVIRSHAHVWGDTEIGDETHIFPFAAVGEIPQDLKFQAERTRVVIGARNQIREHVTIHCGTRAGGGVTRIGDDNLLMVGTHVGHDSQIGSQTVLANHVELAGHVTIGDCARVQAGAAIQQFLRVGESTFVAARAGVMQDLAPFTWCYGHPARVLKLNRIGLERRGLSAEDIFPIERAFRMVFRSQLRPRDAFDKARANWPESAEVERFISFLEKSDRGFARLRKASGPPDEAA